MSENVINNIPAQGEKMNVTAPTFFGAIIAAVIFTISIMTFINNQSENEVVKFSEINLAQQKLGQQLNELATNVNRIVVNFDNRLNEFKTQWALRTAKRFDEDRAVAFSMELCLLNPHLKINCPNPRKLRDYLYFNNWQAKVEAR